MKPKICPVCGTESILPVERKTVADFNGDGAFISGVLAYRCSQGHLFMVAAEHRNKAALQTE